MNLFQTFTSMKSFAPSTTDTRVRWVRRLAWLVLAALVGSTTGCLTTSPSGTTTPAAPPSATRSVHFNREDVKRVFVVSSIPRPYASGQATIESVFVEVLLQKGYAVVTRDLPLIAQELKRTRDPAFDQDTAVRLGKLGSASHVVLIETPGAQINRSSGATMYPTITAKLISVETSDIVLMARHATFNPFAGAESRARSTAQQFP